ncbi:MAG: response regulator [Myxococcales bacterium]|nr:response regulator [Myxococcales bacterium]
MTRALLSVLLVEDNRGDADLIGALLSGVSHLQIALKWVRTFSDAVVALQDEHFDAVLLDLTLPESRGVDAVMHLVQVAPHVAVLVLTGVLDEAVGFEALDAGAADYLMKPEVDSARLARALHAAVAQKRTERELFEQRNLLQSVLESLADAVVVIEQGGLVKMSNPAAEKMLGGRLREALSAAGEAWFFDEDARTPMPRDTQPWVRAARGDVVDGAEIFLQVDGQAGRWLSANIRPFSVDGLPRGGVAVLRDITPRREQEEHVRALNAELRRQIAERSRALVALEAANRLKRQFLDVVSHELRTPLTPILGYARLLLRKEEHLDANQREAIELIHESGQRLHRVVESILDFQRLRAEPVVPQPRPTTLRALLSQVVDAGRRLMGDAPVEMRLELDPDLPASVLCDGTRVEQILQRLVENAVTYTPHGSVVMHAAWTAEMLDVSVTDSGVGIEREHLDFIFGEFYQAQPALTRSHGGLGLGLAHARYLAEAMNGELSVSSTPGEGSTFRLRIPAPLSERVS